MKYQCKKERKEFCEAHGLPDNEESERKRDDCPPYLADMERNLFEQLRQEKEAACDVPDDAPKCDFTQTLHDLAVVSKIIESSFTV